MLFSALVKRYEISLASAEPIRERFDFVLDPRTCACESARADPLRAAFVEHGSTHVRRSAQTIMPLLAALQHTTSTSLTDARAAKHLTSQLDDGARSV